MFERFTDRARHVIVVAQEEARDLRDQTIRPDHLLLGLLEGDGIAAVALRQSGADATTVRAAVAKRFPGGGTSLQKVPFSKQGKKALELSLREALRLGHNYIGTEHLLLGLLRSNDLDPAVVAALGVDTEELRKRVVELVAAAGRRTAHSPALRDALDRARRATGPAAMTTGQLATAVIADPESQAAKALARLGVTPEALAGALAEVDVTATSDAPDGPATVTVTVGGTATVVHDPGLATMLQHFTAEEIRTALHQALDDRPEAAG